MTFHPVGVAPVMHHHGRSMPILHPPTAPTHGHPTTSRSKNGLMRRLKLAPAMGARTGMAACVDTERPVTGVRTPPATPHLLDSPCQQHGIDRPRLFLVHLKSVPPREARHAPQSWWPSTVYPLAPRRAFSPIHGTTTPTRPFSLPFPQLASQSRRRLCLTIHIIPLCGCCRPPSTISQKSGEKWGRAFA